MFKAPASEYLVPFDGSFRVAEASTEGVKNWPSQKKLKKHIKKLDQQQKALYAADRHAILLIFQGMDAAGKDSPICHARH